MNDDELKKLWQEQRLREPSQSAAQLISAMQQKTSQLRRIVIARDLRELAACFFVIIVFGCYAVFLHAHQPVARLGDWIVVGSSIFIGWKLVHTRRSTPAAPSGATTVETLRAELKAVNAQSRLLGSVLWWYLLPGFIGLLLMTWGNLPINESAGLMVMIPADMLVTLIFIATYAFIYWLNQLARTTQLLPLEAQLEALLRSAETGEPLVESQAVDLNSLALTKATSEQIDNLVKSPGWVWLGRWLVFARAKFSAVMSRSGSTTATPTPNAREDVGQSSVESPLPSPPLVPLVRQEIVPSETTNEPPQQILWEDFQRPVQPIEFKVAFWQIALWSELGLLGIWFFLMLSLTISSQGWKVEQEAQEPPHQSVLVDEPNRYSAVARTVVGLLNAADYPAIQRLYNPKMTETFPPSETTAFYTRLAERFGNIEKFDGPTGNGHRGWTAFRLHCQRGELTMSLALDTDDKIAGIHFRPEARPWPEIKSFVRQLFSPLHLALIVPFFLAGLVYSWLIQKTTERAVGISTLGIHLMKGQDLFTWDEIKEVRPFKFLHIQNLWLIKESGEKTIMHWTPLERHSDLKAAVESFAPANHPIRKYLSLLRP